MSGSLAALVDLVDSVSVPRARSERHAGASILRQQIRIISTELRSLRNRLASLTKHQRERYACEDMIAVVERDLRIRRWELSRLS